MKSHGMKGMKAKAAKPAMKAGKFGGAMPAGPVSGALKGLQKPVTQSLKTDRGTFGLK